MGTNYYLVRPKCMHCECTPDRLHIGKSSMGWPFVIHIIPQENLTSWTDWFGFIEKCIKQGHGFIENEYGDNVSLTELNSIVYTKRKHKDDPHVTSSLEPPKRIQDPVNGDILMSCEFC